ncbi:MAG: RRXRR domain-containing protein [Desulfovibrio sp.]|nr:RRXRR domain-containing protein [Desulfovibrio sp.]
MQKMFPFTIRLVDRLVENSVVSDIVVKIDPGSKEGGVTVARRVNCTLYVLQFFDLIHRATQMHKNNAAAGCIPSSEWSDKIQQNPSWTS